MPNSFIPADTFAYRHHDHDDDDENRPVPKILFVLKKRELGNQSYSYGTDLSTGLLNSATFVYQMLLDMGVDTKLVIADDNNSIDREVTEYRPTHVILEALWVVPPKFDVLIPLHPTVKWIVRIHSEIPFIANEGIAMQWLIEYALYPNVSISCNAPRIYKAVEFLFRCRFGWDRREMSKHLSYLPNFYPQEYERKRIDNSSDEVNVACFGAVRPFKNHLNQAIAALQFATFLDKKLKFHINGDRMEQGGDPVMKNLVELFKNFEDLGHELIAHPWTTHEEFKIICSEQIDIGMQVSFTETFNIVGADQISVGVPLVASNEVPWTLPYYTADPNDVDDIVNTLLIVWRRPQHNVAQLQRMLTRYTNETKEIWTRYFRSPINY